MPCWWMPDSCANAFSPTIALLRGIGTPTMFDSMREVGIQARGVDARVEIEERIARLQRHDDFFERAVAGALADAVDGALDLPRAGDHGGEAVGHRHAEIVVAVHREADLVDAAHVLAQVAEQLGEFIRHGVADRVRNVHRGGAGLDDGFDHLREEIELGARGVFGRELHVFGRARARSSRLRPPS